ncbi:protein MOS2-like [Argentina anserina]|uniref:protein MOS2-like n=1 Tax=Argentina anserina TaxID=57926 RepID=UPI0021767833|nr:protein MOS2-like [Potentilla anserina]XP_050369867.1 protein MOS2-like [Potentilla anserina]XP_050369868.1 protein MOS2-like [Potentilla anserina]
MKLSFSLPSKSKSSSKPPNPINPSAANQNGDVSKQFVKEFDASQPLSAASQAPVIAPIENEWRPHKKMKNLELPITEPGGQHLRFEPESLAIEPDSNISYGLNVRKSSEIDYSGGGERLRSGAVEETLLQKFKSDLERLADHKGMEEYEGMPVEGFGAALLSGYGWCPGRGIGRNAKEDVKVVEYTKSTDRHGLGFHKNSKEKEKKKKEEVGRERRREEEVAKEVRIVKGRDNVGSRGRVVERLGNGRLVAVKLATRAKEEEGVVVRVNVEDVVEVGSKEEERWRRLRGEDRKPRREEETWLARHIRVRVISKDLRGGKLYLKKGEVVDVVGLGTCDISMDGSREFVQGVSEDFLETALPRRGGPVLVLSGKHKGVFGSLVEKDSDRQTGVVKDADTHVLLNVKLEQIAEFTGDPSYLGY